MNRPVLWVIGALLITGLSGCGAAPFGEGMRAPDVLTRLKSAGSPIGSVQTLNAQSDPNELLGRPGEYTSKVFFADTRIGSEDEFGVVRQEADAGGAVEVFETEADAERRAEYVGGITRGGGPFAEYSYRRGVVFLRLTKSLTPAQAKQYERVLNRL